MHYFFIVFIPVLYILTHVVIIRGLLCSVLQAVDFLRTGTYLVTVTVVPLCIPWVDHTARTAGT